MYLLRRSCRNHIIRDLSAARPSTYHSARLASAPNGQIKRIDPLTSRYHSSESGKEAKHASIRPLTLFAICIPLGYLLSWTVKSQGNGEDADGFVKYTLTKKEAVSSTCSIFTLRPTIPSAVLHSQSIPQRAIFSVQFKQPQLQIARFYTLLPPTQEQEPQEVRFLIRQEQRGEVSGYLHRLPIGSELDLRGKCVEYVLPDQVDKVVFLAGGTGIAPAMQIADAVTGQADMHVLWASKYREDCVGGNSDTQAGGMTRWNFTACKQMIGLWGTPQESELVKLEQKNGLVVAQLESLKEHAQTSSSTNRKQLLIDYFVDEEGSFIERDFISRLLEEARSQPVTSGKKLLFVAGPDGFISHWAGSKIWANGREVQGPIGGVLSQMRHAGWEIVKL